MHILVHAAIRAFKRKALGNGIIQRSTRFKSGVKCRIVLPHGNACAVIDFQARRGYPFIGEIHPVFHAVKILSGFKADAAVVGAGAQSAHLKGVVGGVGAKTNGVFVAGLVVKVNFGIGIADIGAELEGKTLQYILDAVAVIGVGKGRIGK